MQPSTLFELFRRYNLKSRFMGRAFGTSLGLTDSHIMIELAANPDFGAVDLSRALNLNKSTTSRALRELVDGGILSERKGSGDRRRKLMGLTTKGKRVLGELDRAANELIGNFVKNLSTTEVTEFEGYLRYLADNDAAPVVSHRGVESPVLVEMRRYSRAWGVIGRDFLGTGYSSIYWHLFEELCGSNLTPTDLSKRLGVSAPMISAALGKLQRKKLIKRSRVKEDGRSYLVQLTTKGRSEGQRIRVAGAKRIEKALGGLGSTEVDRFIELFAKYADEELGSDGSLTKTTEVTEVVETEDERQELRAQYIKWLVDNNRHHFAPARLIDSENLIIALKRNSVVLGFIEITPSSKKLLNSVVYQNQNYQESLVRMLKYVRGNHRVSEVLVLRGDKASTVARKLGGKESKEGVLLNLKEI